MSFAVGDKITPKPGHGPREIWVVRGAHDNLDGQVLWLESTSTGGYRIVHGDELTEYEIPKPAVVTEDTTIYWCLPLDPEDTTIYWCQPLDPEEASVSTIPCVTTDHNPVEIVLHPDPSGRAGYWAVKEKS